MIKCGVYYQNWKSILVNKVVLHWVWTVNGVTGTVKRIGIT